MCCASQRMVLSRVLHVGHPWYFYDRVDCLTFPFIRDPSSQPVLTSFGFTDPDNMSVELCVNTCIYRGHIYAGVENGEDCCG